MRQVVQSIRNGKLSVVELPDPVVRPGQILVANEASVISAGTERMTMELAKKSLVGKARERPDQVRRVLEKMRTEGILSTVNAVRAKLDEPMTMGYSSSGVVLACGAGVQSFSPGDRVCSNGPHAGVVSVAEHLCAHVPDQVSAEHAAFGVLGAIALHGVRLAELELGEHAFVIGLGLVGQLTVAILAAAGVQVIGTDPDAKKCELAKAMGAQEAAPNLSASTVITLTRGAGADAVLIAASTESNGPIELAGEAVRQRGRVVLLGVTGLDIPRRPFYFKEASFVVSCSYGPGRYDPDYEDRGHDYPIGYVRWTEQRNIQAVLDLMGRGKLNVEPLITHRFDIETAERAYALIETGSEPYMGIVLRYPDSPASVSRRVDLRATRCPGRIGVGCIGAGNFARMVLLPAIQEAEHLRPRLLCSAGGLSAMQIGQQIGFESVTTDEDEVYRDSQVDAVFIITRHDQHARQVMAALEAGKHCFVEKPLALSPEQLDSIDGMLRSKSAAPLLTVGYNRRFSDAARRVREHFSGVLDPLTVSIRFNAGEIPENHWVQHDEEGGGRLIGEACHAVDLATYLVGSPPVRVYAESIGGSKGPTVKDDQAFITFRHANGSISSVAYLSGGDRALPKERVEVYGGGRAAIIDDFRQVVVAADGKTRTFKTRGKGHKEEIEAFATAIYRGQRAPIAWEDLYAISLGTMLAVRSIREGIPFEIPSPGREHRHDEGA